MALIDFIKIRSVTRPRITDFYWELQGFFEGIDLTSYNPISSEYNIVKTDYNTWLLQLDEEVTRKIRDIDLTSDALYLNPSSFSLVLKNVYAYYTLFTQDLIDDLLIYWAYTPAIPPDQFISNVLIEIAGDSSWSARSAEARDILNTRQWNILHVDPDFIEETPAPTPDPTPTPTPTPIPRPVFISITRTPRPTPTNTRTPFPTPTTTPTDVKEPSVITIGGIGRSGDTDGSVCTQGLEEITPTPSNSYNSTPTPTPTPTEVLVAAAGNVKTIAGIGRRGDRDGAICDNVRTIPPTPTSTPTCTLTPSSSHAPYLGVKTIGGHGVPGDRDGAVCDVVPFIIPPTSTPSPTPSVTFTYSGARVFTLAGEGRTGDFDGVLCSYIPPTPSVTKTVRPTNTPTPTSTPTSTPTFTPTNTGTPSQTPESTPTPTPTVSDTSAPTPTPSSSSSATPTPSVTSSVTPTPSVTSSVTPTPSITPSPSNTPSLTPSSTPVCLVITPKIETPCCAEPVTVADHGSTTFNSRVTTYAKLLNRIKSSLGYPLIQLEITDEQIYNAIDISIEFFTKFAGYTEEYLVFRSDLYRKGYGLPIGDLFSVTPELSDNIDYACPKVSANGMGYDFDLNARRIVMSVFSVAPGDNSGINTLFTIEQTIAQQAYFGHLLGNIGFDLITFDILKIWLKTREKVLALKPYFRFYPEQQLLRLTPEPENRGTPYFGIIGAYVQKPIRDLISQLWIYKYTMAQIKITMAHTRGKYAGTGLFGGQTVNYTDLMSQGTKELDELEKELKSDLIDREPIPFFLG